MGFGVAFASRWQRGPFSRLSGAASGFGRAMNAKYSRLPNRWEEADQCRWELGKVDLAVGFGGSSDFNITTTFH